MGIGRDAGIAGNCRQSPGRQRFLAGVTGIEHTFVTTSRLTCPILAVTRPRVTSARRFRSTRTSRSAGAAPFNRAEGRGRQKAGPSAPPSSPLRWERHGDEAAPAVPIAVPAMPKVANPDALRARPRSRQPGGTLRVPDRKGNEERADLPSTRPPRECGPACTKGHEARSASGIRTGPAQGWRRMAKWPEIAGSRSLVSSGGDSQARTAAPPRSNPASNRDGHYSPRANA